MTEWRVSTDSEIVDLATGLRSLDGSQPMDAVPRLAEAFGWKVLTVHPDRAMLDAGFGMASGKIHGRDGRIVDIKLRVTDFASNDTEGRARSRDAFVTMVAALTGAFGEPTTRVPGATAEVRWSGPETTLVAEDLGRSVQLSLTDNSWLALHDQAIELDQQEQG
ncbi:DUF6301 family protein [Nocardia sp. NPDC057455]|uniref:DUF6301 family protein n=1 Tax=Nocardia sp. NPDC057455 TaxID=3346138 RepID=UPI00366B923E